MKNVHVTLTTVLQLLPTLDRLRNSPPLATIQPWACPSSGEGHCVLSAFTLPIASLNPSYHKTSHTRRIHSGLWLLCHPHISIMGWVTHITLFCTGATGPLHGKLHPELWFKEPQEYTHFSLSLSLSYPVVSVSTILSISLLVLVSLPCEYI